MADILALEDNIRINEERVKKREQMRERREERLKEEASKAKSLDIEWGKIKKSPAVAHWIKFLETAQEMHVRVATKGVGVKVIGQDEEGKDILDTVSLSPEERLSHLDRAAGIDEALDYLVRHLAS